MNPKTTKPRTKPTSPAAAPRRRAAATSHEPPQGEKTATREGESSHAAPVDRSPEKSNSAAAEGSPASAAPSTPATHGDRRALVGAIVGAVPRRERGAFAGAVYAAAAAPEAHQRAAARVDLNIGPHAYHAAALLRAYGVDVVAIDAPPRADAAERDALAFDLDTAAAVLDAGGARPRLLRVPFALDAADDLDALLASIGEECERGCNGDLAISCLAAQRVAHGGGTFAFTTGDDGLAGALGAVMNGLARDLRLATKRHREDVHAFACARRNDDAATVARRAETLRSTRRDLVRIGGLVGRLGAALADALAAEE